VELLSSYETATAGVPNTSPLIGGEPLGDWTIVETPGHAPDHICLFRERDRVLISGDHLLPDVTPNINLTPDSPDALEDYLRSLDKTSDLEPRLVLPAHGEPFADAVSQARRVGAHHARRLARLRMLLSEVPTSTDSLARNEFGTLADPHDRVLAEMETHAHLEHLRRRGLARACAVGQWLAY
jgi:glyoxylase-like metal-dependent hydrolase (beta-lactamase superfamily II)